MLFYAEILKETSYDPYFKIKFSYENDMISINEGYAEVIRQAPKPIITYGRNTSEKLKAMDKSKLELEIMNKVIEYMLSNGALRSLKNNRILGTA